jgi:hypothetical protein
LYINPRRGVDTRKRGRERERERERKRDHASWLHATHTEQDMC